MLSLTDHGLAWFMWGAFGIPLLVLPAASLAVLLPLTRHRSASARRAAWAGALVPTAIWEAGVLLSLNGWRLSAPMVGAILAILCMTALLYPALTGIADRRDQILRERAKTHSREEVHAANMRALLALLLGGAAIGALLWIVWR